jgi:hypothetical protein
MDPFIEANREWGDFHLSLLAAMRGKLNQVLPQRYRAKIDIFVFVQEKVARARRRLAPDVYLVERPKEPKPEAGTAAVAAPQTIVLPRTARKKHRSVVIVDRESSRVVTALEVLSPANKTAGADRRAYLAKRDDYLGSGVNLVEIDLLRGGKRVLLGKSARVPGDYYILVCRSWELPRADLWPLSLRDSLPQVPVPLAEDVPDVLLPLRECADRAYDEGSYGTELRYDKPLVPPPRRGEAAWIKQVLASRRSE